MAKTLYGEYGYTGAVQTVSLPAGLYLFELYGAQGYTGYSGSRAGNGGSAVGVLSFSNPINLNLFIGGGAGTYGKKSGWNGGGTGASYGGGGGGATDIRIGGVALTDRAMVAGGGGGGGFSSDHGGAGGGLVGGTGVGGTSVGQGGTQTEGGGGYTTGSLGIGGNGHSSYGGGGGGGYYGGGGGGSNCGGGGGSSYIGGANGYLPLYATTIGNKRSGTGLIEIYTIDSLEDIFPLTIPYSGGMSPVFLAAGTYSFDLYGAAGGYETDYTDVSAGKGGRASGNISLVNDDTVHVYVGGRNGFNGGGSGNSSSGSGGGGTDIRIGGIALTDRVLVAAGGGGQGLNGGSISTHGGDGGGLIGESVIDQYNPTYAPTGGTQTEGGYSNGSFGQGGTGLSRGGGGGGGYYGGGGGSGLSGNYYVAGAGGSSYYGGANGYIPTNPSTETGVNTGNGYAVITLIPQSDSAAVNIQGQNNLIGLKLFTPTDTLENCLRIGTTNGIRAFKLVDVSNANASPLRIKTCNSIKAISLE